MKPSPRLHLPCGSDLLAALPALATVGPARAIEPGEAGVPEVDRTQPDERIALIERSRERGACITAFGPVIAGQGILEPSGFTRDESIGRAGTARAGAAREEGC
jgi:hypothetical protein